MRYQLTNVMINGSPIRVLQDRDAVQWSLVGLPGLEQPIVHSVPIEIRWACDFAQVERRAGLLVRRTQLELGMITARLFYRSGRTGD